MLLIIQQNSFEFLPLITQLMLIWLKNSTQNVQKYVYADLKSSNVPIGGPYKFPRSCDHVFSHLNVRD